MDIWAWLWIAWIVLFAGFESIALCRKAPGDTLSEHVWRWFGIGVHGDRPKATGWVRLRRVALLSSLVWLVLHFLTGGFF